MSTGRSQALVEREWELEAVGVAAARLARGEGGLLVFEGPAGIGKTSLLAELRNRVAGHPETRTLAARGAELEAAYAFGVARQLLEPAVRERGARLTGPAALAPALLGLAGSPEPGEEDVGFAALHALHWLVAELASEAPVLLVVDDAQWADRSSERFLTFLAHRVAEHPVLIALGLRRGPEGERRRGLARLAARPDATVLEPRPLSVAGAEAALTDRLGTRPASGFAEAAREIVGGNPLLLDQLTVQLRREGIAPTAESAGRLRDVDAGSVARSVLVRVAGLGDADQEVARAVAVLGPGASEDRIAAVAEIGPEEVPAALGRLEGVEALAPGERAFAHAIVRDAVYRDLSPAARSAAHARAARALLAEGPSAQAVAGHLLEARPAADAEVLAPLRAAAAQALERGVPESAVRFLTRALEEPPPESARSAILADLGQAEVQAGAPGARDHFRAAAKVARGPERAPVLRGLGHACLMAGDMEGAAQGFRAAAGAEGETETRLRAEAELASALINSRRFDEAARGLEPRRELSGHTPGERMLLAVCAFASAQTGEPREETLGLARRALGDGRLLAEQTSSSLLVHEIAWALIFLDALDDAEALLEDALADARRRGAVSGFALAGFGRAWARLRRGDLADARAEAESSYGTRELYLWHATGPLAAAILVDALAEQGGFAAAAAVLHQAGLAGEVPDVAIFNLGLFARGRLRIAQGGRAEGVRDVLLAGERESAVGGRTPGGIPWRSTVAEALAGGEDGATARELAAAELDHAQRLAAPRALGVALRAAGIARGEHEGLDLLEEATATLAGTGAALEHARAQVAWGAALRRANRRGEAREHLRAALDAASRCGARPLAAQAQEELAATGARPRREVLSGTASLTPTELRIARLAARGRTNPQIAQDLFVTRKNVEFHLSNAYRKLGITSRGGLARALGGPAGTEPGG